MHVCMSNEQGKGLRPCEQGLAHLQEAQSQAQSAPPRGARGSLSLSLSLVDQMGNLTSL